MENYKEKYKHAIEGVQEILSSGQENIALSRLKLRLQPFFPELAESEDERIRKALIELVHDTTGDSLWVDYNAHKDETLAWLEKQGEHKPYGQRKECEDCQFNYAGECKGYCVLKNEYKPIDNVEPKFKVGDWITDGEHTWKIVEVKPLDYILQSQDGNIVDDTISYVDEQFHSFTIEDAKDGDVLYSIDSKQPFIYKERPQFSQARGYCCINKFGEFAIWNTSKCVICTDKYIPATKEQRDLLFSKMRQEGYEWDADKKEVKKIEPKKLDPDMVVEWLYEQVNSGSMQVDNIEKTITTFKKDFEI